LAAPALADSALDAATDGISLEQAREQDAIAAEQALDNALVLGKRAVFFVLLAVLIMVVVKRVLSISRRKEN
jgi:hypothetical protein